MKAKTVILSFLLCSSIFQASTQNLPAITYAEATTTPTWRFSNTIAPLPDPNYYSVSCYVGGSPQGFWVIEVGADKISATYKGLVQLPPSSVLASTSNGLLINDEPSEK